MLMVGGTLFYCVAHQTSNINTIVNIKFPNYHSGNVTYTIFTYTLIPPTIQSIPPTKHRLASIPHIYIVIYFYIFLYYFIIIFQNELSVRLMRNSAFGERALKEAPYVMYACDHRL